MKPCNCSRNYSKNDSETGDHVQWPLEKSLCWVVIGQVRQFTTFKLETSDFMAEWSKPPLSPVFPPHTAFPKRLVFDFHLSIQIFFLSLLSTVCSSAHGSNKNENYNTVYQRSFHCINNNVTVAIINIVHTLWSAVHLQQNVIALIFLDWWRLWECRATHEKCKEQH